MQLHDPACGRGARAVDRFSAFVQPALEDCRFALDSRQKLARDIANACAEAFVLSGSEQNESADVTRGEQALRQRDLHAHRRELAVNGTSRLVHDLNSIEDVKGGGRAALGCGSKRAGDRASTTSAARRVTRSVTQNPLPLDAGSFDRSFFMKIEKLERRRRDRDCLIPIQRDPRTRHHCFDDVRFEEGIENVG
jgi:hypothetical protein